MALSPGHRPIRDARQFSQHSAGQALIRRTAEKSSLISRERVMTPDSHDLLRMNALPGRIKTPREEREHRHSFCPFYARLNHQILSPMALLNSVPDTFTLSGDNESRIAQLLRITQHQIRVAQIAARPRMQDALTDLEDTLSDQLAALEHAAEDDKFDAEASGQAERERRSWQPMRAA